MGICFLLQNIVDTEIQKANLENRTMDTDQIAKRFEQMIDFKFRDDDFCNLLACTGFIPDLYPSDSSQETLYTKLIEVLVSIWATRMGYNSKYIKEKASYEDVNIEIKGKIIVCDAKSFRLGRSQGAPNVKDFLKLEDIRKWRSRYMNGLGGLVTYPDTHDWAKGSDAYLYCTMKECPTIMLPYIYLATILHYKNNFNPATLINLWNYDRLFPTALEKKMEGGNKIPYWDKINGELARILNISNQELCNQINTYKEIQKYCINEILKALNEKKGAIVCRIKNQCEQMSDKEARKELAAYKIDNETKNLDDYIGRIKKFRLK